MAKSSLRPVQPVTPAGGTVTVLSTINIGGLRNGQTALVDDNEFTRGLIRQGLWILYVKPEVLEPVAPLAGSDALAETFGADLGDEVPVEEA